MLGIQDTRLEYSKRNKFQYGKFHRIFTTSDSRSCFLIVSNSRTENDQLLQTECNPGAFAKDMVDLIVYLFKLVSRKSAYFLLEHFVTGNFILQTSAQVAKSST